LSRRTNRSRGRSMTRRSMGRIIRDRCASEEEKTRSSNQNGETSPFHESLPEIRTARAHFDFSRGSEAAIIWPVGLFGKKKTQKHY